MLRVIDKKVYDTNVPIFVHGEIDSFEAEAIRQLKNLASLPFIFHHVAGMPDLHVGYGMPIGGVVATIDAVIPYAAGYDLGCGMLYIKTNIRVENISPNILKKLEQIIRNKVPMGKKHRDSKCAEHELPFLSTEFKDDNVIMEQYQSIRKQLGTLGGGNHFIEIQVDSDGCIGFMIHCGSRNIGKRVCERYDKIAQNLNAKYYSRIPKNWQLAFLPIDTEEAQSYLWEMNWCLEFAEGNRRAIMNDVLESFYEIFEEKFSFGKSLNIHHNYISQENHFGKNVWVHRKGATLAREGTLGIIPGSCGSPSYLVKGKGCTNSFMSCSHGAGRSMSRTAAKDGSKDGTIKPLDVAAELKKIEAIGAIPCLSTQKEMDEAPGSYKDISQVMANQTDLVDIVMELKPLITMKAKKEDQ